MLKNTKKLLMSKPVLKDGQYLQLDSTVNIIHNNTYSKRQYKINT